MDSEEHTVTLSPREQRRGVVLNQVLAGRLSSEQAAAVLRVSIRQLRQLKNRYQAEGPAGLVHGDRGRRPCQAWRRRCVPGCSSWRSTSTPV